MPAVYRGNIKPSTICECGEHAFTLTTNGYVAFSDSDDVEILRRYSWYATSRGGTFYARATRPLSEGGKAITLHRAILPGVAIVDHVDGNGMNNRRSNIREATTQENGANHRRKAGKTTFVGVQKTRRRFKAVLNQDGKRIHIGTYSTAEEAAIARDDAAILRYGVFARLNFPERARSRAQGGMGMGVGE